MPPLPITAVEFGSENGPNVVGAVCGGHEGPRELFGKVRKSLGLLVEYDGLHLSAADGAATMPELARWVQVRHVVRGSTPSGIQGKGHSFVGVGHAAVHSSWRLGRRLWLSVCVTGR